MNNEATRNQGPDHGKRNTALGVTAGLLGGGAIGLIMAVPSFTSAATDDTSSVATPVVALQDDTDAPETDRPEPGQQLRGLLQQLVDDGTIDATQADAVTELLMENRPERGDRRPGHHQRGPGFDGEVVAGLLSIDVDTLRTELRAGNSIADIAESNDVDPQTVIDALVTEADGHIDLMVEDGRLTLDEGDAMKDNVVARITARVNGERPGRG